MVLSYLVSAECLSLFMAFTFTKPCIEKTIVNCLNCGILAGSVAVKLPQIIKILVNKSVNGLSESAFILELASTVTSCLYHVLLNHPFSSWGEMFLISIQCAIQCVLYWIFAPSVSMPIRIGGSAVFVGATMWVLQGGLPVAYYSMLGGCPIILSIWSRLPQIVLNARQGHTGQLALLTFALSGLGNLARVFTTLKQTPDDRITLLAMVVASLLNFTLVAQIGMYWKATNKAVKKTKSTAPETSVSKRPSRSASAKTRKL